MNCFATSLSGVVKLLKITAWLATDNELLGVEQVSHQVSDFGKDDRLLGFESVSDEGGSF